ncbi:glycosyltransferase family 4 protein [Paenibacillus tarimensis]
MVMPKVAFITPGTFTLPSAKSSSVERVVENIVPQLAGEAAPRIYGRASRKLPRRGSLMGVPCFRYPAADKLKYIRSVARSLRQYRPDVVVVENRPKFVLQIKKSYPQARVWLSLHSSTFIGPNQIRRSRLRRCFAGAERIVVNSKFLGEVVSSLVPEASPKIHVVHLGVEPSKFISQYSPEGMARREKLRRARGWENRNVILFMGRLIPSKGVHHLLQVLPELAASRPDTLLVIVGSAFYGSHRMTSYSRKLGRLGRMWPNHVKFVPYVSYDQVPNWFLAADIAVVPSSGREAFGLVNVEAMACGLPVVATRAGGMTEIIEDGTTGYLADPEDLHRQLRDRLLLLLENAELRTSMGLGSRERIERHFTWANTAERWREMLREHRP